MRAALSTSILQFAQLWSITVPGWSILRLIGFVQYNRLGYR